jgi:hypothetical protein
MSRVHVAPAATANGELEAYGAPPISVVPSEQLRLQPTSLGYEPPEQVITEDTDSGEGGEGGEGGGVGGRSPPPPQAQHMVLEEKSVSSSSSSQEYGTLVYHKQPFPFELVAAPSRSMQKEGLGDGSGDGEGITIALRLIWPSASSNTSNTSSIWFIQACSGSGTFTLGLSARIEGGKRSRGSSDMLVRSTGSHCSGQARTKERDSGLLGRPTASE